MWFRLLRLACAVLLAAAAAGAEGQVFEGHLRSADGAPIAGGVLRVHSAAGALLAETRSDQDGRFRIGGPGPGGLWLWIEAPGFAARSLRLTPFPSRTVDNSSVAWRMDQDGPGLQDLGDIVLHPEPLRTSITVTASRGGAVEEGAVPQMTTVRTASQFAERPMPTVAHTIEDAAGVTIQQTTPGQASPFLRGLTGYHTLLLVDGIRLNTAIFRSGPNQYLSFLDTPQAATVEVLQGPAGSQYGSDALGGVIQVLTRQATPDGPRRYPRLQWSELFDSADLSLRHHGQATGGTARWSWLASGSFTRHNDLRTGKGSDSHHVFTRYLGLGPEQVRELVGTRLQDTAYGQVGAELRSAWRPDEDTQISVSYLRGEVRGLRSYRDQMGGLGRLQALAQPQTLGLLYGRVEREKLPVIGRITGTISWNRQRDDSTRQGTRFSDPVTNDYNRVDALGTTLQGVRHLKGQSILVAGIERYAEGIASRRVETDSLRGEALVRRAQYPNGTRYSQLGAFAQADWDAPGQPWRLSGGLRATGVQFASFASRNQTPAGASLGVPDESLGFGNLSYHVAATFRAKPWLVLHGIHSTGFRAPNANDLGTVGLTGLGYEVPARDAMALGAAFGRDASESALPAGVALRALQPERLRNTEAGIRLRAAGLVIRLQGFLAQFEDPIVRRTLLFPLDRGPTTLSGVEVFPLAPTAAQQAAGVRMFATAEDPRGLKAFVNDGRARYAGMEARIQAQVGATTWLEASGSFVSARELDPVRPVRRLPPAQGVITVRHVPAHGRWWGEVSVLAAARQDAFNAGDFDDERIGASRRRSDIASFFRSALMSPWLSSADAGSGAGGELRFLPTGETLRQLQDRVLPLGADFHGVVVANDQTRVPLYVSTPGWARLDVRMGVRLHKGLTLHAGMQNVADASYRVHGSGMDAPGRAVFAGLRAEF